ncbi:MAG: hypothetical protein ACREH8_09200 [Opitutaceae bacterium]
MPAKVETAPVPVVAPASAASQPVPPPATPKAAARERGWPVDANVRARIDRALASGDLLEWMPALSDVMSPIYQRGEVIALLTDILKYPNWEVRARAADLLLQLGSYAGVPVLKALLREAAGGAALTELAVATAATRLHLYRQPIDHQALMQAYQRYKMSELLNVAVMQQVPELAALARERWAGNLQGYEATRIAAFAGLKDRDAIEHYRWGLTAEPRIQLISQWALFQATGDETYLDQVIAAARQTAGIDPKTESSWRLMKGEAFDLLKISMVPKARLALQEISDLARTKTGDEDAFARSFTALFYLHRDYAFVDQRLMQFFRGEFQGSGIDRGLMMRIAADRRTPELEAAARQFNSGAYDREFIQERNRPVEQWVNLSNVPVSVAPPLSEVDGQPQR